jgi:hypothetical protein
MKNSASSADDAKMPAAMLATNTTAPAAAKANPAGMPGKAIRTISKTSNTVKRARLPLSGGIG